MAKTAFYAKIFSIYPMKLQDKERRLKRVIVHDFGLVSALSTLLPTRITGFSFSS